jgi:acyl-CoA thioesterase-1
MRLSFLYRRHFIATLLLAVAAGLSGAADQPAAAPGRTILVMGDSLSAEYGLKRGTGWVALLEQRLARDGIAAKIVNASISGETTSGGRSRLQALLTRHRPSHVIIELGANDALRGLPLQATQDNLNQMTQAAQKAGAKVLLVGMMLPPNYGQDYSKRFAATYQTVAHTRQVPLVPFLLKGVADRPDAAKLFQSDRIHPTEAAHPTMLDNVWSELKKQLL